MAVAESDVTKSGKKGIGCKAIDHVEFYVSNARLVSYFFRRTFGFHPIAFAGLETGLRDRESIVLEQGAVRIVLTAPLIPSGTVAEQVHEHGDGVRDIALAVDDAEQAFEEAVSEGARPLVKPTMTEDDHGRVIRAVIGSYGDTVHSLIQRDGTIEGFLPGYQPGPVQTAEKTGLIKSIDHFAISVEAGRLNHWIDFYTRALGFHISHQEDVSTEYSSMNSKVVQNANGQIRFPMMEPSSNKRRSQIEEYLKYYRGPGVQHIAFLCDDIIATTRKLRERKMEFLPTPRAYYDGLADRVGNIEEDIGALSDLGILVDRDNNGYLLQIFSRPLHSRPTIFFELIQRKGAEGFGGKNIKALFEAIEREQACRGNL